MQNLRGYQGVSVHAVEDAWRSSPSVLLVAPTGSGKTTMLAHLVAHFHGRVLILCPWLSLVSQSRDRLLENGIEAGTIGAKIPLDRVVLSTVATAARRDLPRFDLVVIDEAHRSMARQCSEIMARHQGKTLGLTATPIRLDGQLLSKRFARTIISCTHEDLVRQGYLVPLTVYGVAEEIDVSGLPIDRRTHDFQTRALERASMRPKLLADAVQEYTRLGQWRPTFCYCVTVAHGQAVLEHYRKAGITADLVTGETAPRERAEMLEQMRQGRLKVLVNCAVLTEGIDFPELGCVQVLRGTASLGLWLQILGRGCRVAPGKHDCIVLDHAGNTRRHGFPDDERNWEQEAERQENANRRSERKRPPRAKTCPACGRMIGAHLRRCPHCGFEFAPITARGELERLVPGARRRRARRPLA